MYMKSLSQPKSNKSLRVLSFIWIISVLPEQAQSDRQQSHQAPISLQSVNQKLFLR